MYSAAYKLPIPWSAQRVENVVDAGNSFVRSKFAWTLRKPYANLRVLNWKHGRLPFKSQQQRTT